MIMWPLTFRWLKHPEENFYPQNKSNVGLVTLGVVHRPSMWGWWGIVSSGGCVTRGLHWLRLKAKQTEEMVMEALGCRQRKLTESFGDSDNAISHAGQDSPEVELGGSQLTTSLYHAKCDCQNFCVYAFKMLFIHLVVLGSNPVSCTY